VRKSRERWYNDMLSARYCLTYFCYSSNQLYRVSKSGFFLKAYLISCSTPSKSRNSVAVNVFSSKVLITSHDAFSYFGRRYGIEVRGIQGISTLSEVGLKDISDMVNFVIEREIKSIFVETSTSDKTAQSIVDGAEDNGYELVLDGPLYSDALGEPDSEGGTYIGMVKSNVRVIVNGLK